MHRFDAFAAWVVVDFVERASGAGDLSGGTVNPWAVSRFRPRVTGLREAAPHPEGRLNPGRTLPSRLPASNPGTRPWLAMELRLPTQLHPIARRISHCTCLTNGGNLSGFAPLMGPDAVAYAREPEPWVKPGSNDATVVGRRRAHGLCLRSPDSEHILAVLMEVRSWTALVSG